jgi:hypothetical protein
MEPVQGNDDKATLLESELMLVLLLALEEFVAAAAEVLVVVALVLPKSFTWWCSFSVGLLLLLLLLTIMIVVVSVVVIINMAERWNGWKYDLDSLVADLATVLESSSTWPTSILPFFAYSPALLGWVWSLPLHFNVLIIVSVQARALYSRSKIRSTTNCVKRLVATGLLAMMPIVKKITTICHKWKRIGFISTPVGAQASFW